MRHASVSVDIMENVQEGHPKVHTACLEGQPGPDKTGPRSELAKESTASTAGVT